MMRTSALFVLALYTAGAAGLAAAQQTARGIVFHDMNRNGARDEGERGVPKVPVSNGEAVVLTDDKGAYEVPVRDDAVIFVIKPKDWKTPVTADKNLPRFYYLHKPEGSPEMDYSAIAPTGPLPESVDFALYKGEEPTKFKAICFGDPQPRNQKEVSYIYHDVIEELVGHDAAFGMTLGDLVFDSLELFETTTGGTGLLGVPWYHIIGNHDINFDAPARRHVNDTFESFFGPSYYAYNFGEVHFIVLDNIWYDVEEDEYHGEFGDRQLEFVRNDLKYVPEERLIVLLMHIPLTETDDKRRLLALLGDRPYTFSLSAHTHTQYNNFLELGTDVDALMPHHHLVHNTVSGSWWGGGYDELGIPHTTMRDGAPNGYSIITFDGHDYSLRYKAARRPLDYQMKIHAPESVRSDQAAETEVVVNVFGGSSRSTVEMRLDDETEWRPMERFEGKDPYYQEQWDRQMRLLRKIAREKGLDPNNEDALRKVEREYRSLLGRGLPEPDDSTHLWRGTLPAGPHPGYHLIHVRATDMFNQRYEDVRIIRIQ